MPFIPILSGKGTDENAETYAGQKLFNPKSKIQNGYHRPQALLK
jgi:hypothetical protein